MLDNLYTDIGAKIKNWAKWIFIIEAISAIIGGIGLMVADVAFIGFIVLICGPFVAWVSSWILYAFGELVEDVHAIRNKEGNSEEVAPKRKAEEKAESEDGAIKKTIRQKSCPQCGDLHNFDKLQCPNCNYKYSS